MNLLGHREQENCFSGRWVVDASFSSKAQLSSFIKQPEIINQIKITNILIVNPYSADIDLDIYGSEAWY